MGDVQSMMHDFSPCGALLRKMGYRHVVMAFEHVIATLHDDHWVVGMYQPAEKRKRIEQLAASIPPNVIEFMTALVSQGLHLVIVTELTCTNNGRVVASPHGQAYQFQGSLMIESVLRLVLDEHVYRLVHVYEGSTHTLITKYASPTSHASETLIIHYDGDLVRRLRQQNYGAIMIDDHMAGLRL